MSMSHSISAQLATLASKENIKKILSNGSQMGCTYYHLCVNGMEDGDSCKLGIQLDPDQGANFIFNTLQKRTSPPDLHELIPGLATKFLDTEFHLFFHPTQQNNLKIGIAPIAYIWKIKDEHGFSTVDFARYLGIVAKLCKNCVIENIKVEID